MRARFTITEWAAPGEVFAPDAFASQVGRQVPVTGAGGGTAELISAVVAADGLSARLMFECWLDLGHAVGVDDLRGISVREPDDHAGGNFCDP